MQKERQKIIAMIISLNPLSLIFYSKYNNDF